jgi:tetratricopeptide (TPR) repeat protein
MAQLADEALAANARLGNPEDPRLHAVRGVAALQQGDMEQALLRLGIATQLAREDGDDYLLNIVLVAQSGILGFLGDVEQSSRDAEEATAAARRCGTTSGLAQALVNYGWILRDSEPARALAALDEAAQLAARVGTPMALAFAYANMAVLRARQGDHAGAGNGVRQAIAAARRRADRPQLGHVLIYSALTLLAAEATTPAAILAGAARSMLGIVFDVSPDGKLLLTILHGVLDERRVEELGAQGQAMDDDAAVAFALAAVAAAFEPGTDSPAS